MRNEQIDTLQKVVDNLVFRVEKLERGFSFLFFLKKQSFGY